MKTEDRDPATLRPHPRNSRKHPAHQVAAIARSIAEFGFAQPVVVNGDGVILIGHARSLAAQQAGLKAIPVIVRDDLTEAQERALIIADNRLHESGASWDKKLLDEELRHLVQASYDITLTGFDLSEIAQERAVPDEDSVPEPGPAAVSREGDVWCMGHHRLACGSSTDPAAVLAALGGAEPRLMVTDPPYGVEYDADWRNDAVRDDGSTIGGHATGKVMNDDRADWREAWALFPGAVAYVWHDGTVSPLIQRSLKATGFEVREQIIWAKSRHTISRGAYHWQHEPCLFAVRGKKDHWRGGRGRSSVWEITHTRSSTGHSTQKPVEAMRRPMLCHTGLGEAVYEPFMGSGTSLIAAESCGRVSLGVELSPEYVDLAVRRWQSFTGEEAILAATGQTFQEVSHERL